MNRNEIETKVREIISKRLPKVKPEAIGMDTELELLGMDSLTASWILADLEGEFSFVMPGTDNCILKKLGDAVDYVENHCPAKRGTMGQETCPS